MLVRLAREKDWGMTACQCHVRHIRAELYNRDTSSCFMLGLFPAIVVWGISMLGDAFRVLINPRLRPAGTILMKGGIDYMSV
jgi:hypothetical protein